MLGYSRWGTYNDTLEARMPDREEKPQRDYVNLGLGVLFIVVLLLFIFT